MSRKDVQAKLDSYRSALAHLHALEEENPELFEKLRNSIETYNDVRAKLEEAVRSLGTKITIGPFSAGMRKNTAVDINTVALACPRVLLEPGVVTKVDVPRLRDAAARCGVLEKIDATISESAPSITISKGEAKELVFSWPAA